MNKICFARFINKIIASRHAWHLPCYNGSERESNAVSRTTDQDTKSSTVTGKAQRTKLKKEMKMRKQINAIFAVCAMMLGIVLAGCGSSNGDRAVPSNAVTGVAAFGAPIYGTVTLRDASIPAKVVTTATSPDGQFMVNTNGLTPPYILTVSWPDQSSANQLHSFAAGQGRTNINPFSNVVLAAAAGVSDPSEIPANPGPDVYRSIASRQQSVINSLMKKLASLFALYGASQDPVSGEYEADHTGLDALFDDVKISVSNGMISVTNKATGGVIFTAPINNIDSGTFTAGNMPTQPGQVSGASLYDSNCSSCHNALATSTKLGRTAAQVQAAIGSVSAMSSLSKLSAIDIQAIATALGAAPTPPPTPTPTPIDGAALYTSDCSSCHGALATSSKLGRTAAQIQAAIGSVGAMSSFSSLSAAQVQAIAAALASPPPPTPTPTPTPTDGAALYTTNCSGCHGAIATSSVKGKTAAQIQSAIGSVRAMSGLSTLTSAQIQAIATAIH